MAVYNWLGLYCRLPEVVEVEEGAGVLERSMSLIKVSTGVLPTSLTKKSCSITAEDTVLMEGSLKSNLPNRLGWLGYWVRQYSSRAH